MKRIGIVCLAASCVFATASFAGDSVDDVVQRLSSDGLTIGDQKVKLTPFWLPDGMSADEQTAVTDKLAGRRKKQFYGDSISATVESDIRSIKAGDQRIGYSVDFAFIVYATLDDLLAERQGEADDGLRALANESQMKVEELSAQALAKARIKDVLLEEPNGTGENVVDMARLIHGTFILLEKVEISSVVRSVSKHSDESIAVAWEQDRRFHETPVISNKWKFTDNVAGENSSTYNGFAGYAKVTKLKANDGALLVEYHYAFAEPKEWAEERISLRAKLSIVLQ
ncbi:MAG: hypothetical protein KDB27_34120, partial [Planctomycetales bacterium]|nr:hypothetical protein [Planctomycetales bacterium]